MAARLFSFKYFFGGAGTESALATFGPHFRLLSPVVMLVGVIGLVALTGIRWNTWTGDASLQSTDDAYVSADVTRLSSRVSGPILTAAVIDFQRVSLGDLLIQIDPAEYQAQVDQASATVAAAKATLETLKAQIEVQDAAVTRADATRKSAEAVEIETREEQERQQALAKSDAGTQQRLEQATAAYAKAQAEVQGSRAVVAEQSHQLDVLRGTKMQRAADLDAARAALALAKLKFGYTTIVAPFDGVVSRRQVQPGDYVNIGRNLINIVPLPDVYVIANYKETQLTHIAPGQLVDVSVDTFPGQTLRGHVERISPASGSQFALLPPDNATGNFTKVVQRIPVRIALGKDQPLLARLLPGMSVVTRIHVDDGSNGRK